VLLPMTKKTIDNIIYPVQTKRGLKWGKKNGSKQEVTDDTT